MRLYELTEQAQFLYDLLTEDDLDEAEREQIIADTMEGMGAEDKLESYCKIIRQLEFEAANAQTEKMRLAKVQARYESEVERMKKAVSDYYDATGATKPISAGTFRVSKRKSEVANVTDESLIPMEFWRVKREVNRADIKAAIKGGRSVPGAEIAVNYSIQIK